MFAVKYQDIDDKVKEHSEYTYEQDAIGVAKAILIPGRWVIVFDPNGHSVYSERM